jgi:hypothetical protein
VLMHSMHRTRAEFLAAHFLRRIAAELRKPGSQRIRSACSTSTRAGQLSGRMGHAHYSGGHQLSVQTRVCDAPYLVVFGRRSAWFRPISTIWCDKTDISLKTYECFFHYTTLRCLL